MRTHKPDSGRATLGRGSAFFGSIARGMHKDELIKRSRKSILGVNGCLRRADSMDRLVDHLTENKSKPLDADKWRSSSLRHTDSFSLAIYIFHSLCL